MNLFGAKTRIVPADQARVYNLRLGEARILVDGKQSGGALWMGVFRLEPGFLTPVHKHVPMDEHFFVLNGVLSLFLDKRWRNLDAGASAIIPRGVAHAQGNFGKQTVSLLSMGKPAGFERFFAAQHEILSRLSDKAPDSLAKIAALVSQFDTEVLGPAPLIGSSASAVS